MTEFVECATCTAKPGSPTLCASCLHNRAAIHKLARENEALTNGYVMAAPAVSATIRPLVGICVVIVKEGQILLGKRKGSHGEGEYSTPGGHLEHGESFAACAAREVLEETGLQIGRTRFLRVLNCMQYAPKHYVDIALAAEWNAGDPQVLEPDKVDRWDWYDPRDLPTPLFTMVTSAITTLLNAHDLSLLCEDLP